MKIQNIKQLRDDLSKVYEDLRSGKLEPREAKEINNTAGKLISTVKVQLDYAGLRGEKPEIDFLC